MQTGKILLLSFFLLGMFFFAPAAKPAHADCWGCSAAATYLGDALKKIHEYTQNTLLSSLKVASYQLLSQQITSIVSGNGQVNGAQFITDWQNFLYGQAEKTTRVIVNDFFNEALRGVDSVSYVPAEGSVTGSGGHATYIGKGVKTALKSSTPKYDLNEKCSADDPTLGFIDAESTGKWTCLNAFVGNPMNNWFGSQMTFLEKQAEELAKQIKTAEIKAIANAGYKDVVDKKTGLVKTPGTVIKGIFDSLNNQLIGLPSTAKSPEEIAGMTASTFVNSLLKQAMQQGLARVENEAKRLAQEKINEALSRATENMGPVGQFIDRSGATSRIKSGTNRWLLGT